MTVEENNPSFTNVLGQLAQNTGMHGLPNIYRSGSLIRKFVWTLILIAGLGKSTTIFCGDPRGRGAVIMIQIVVRHTGMSKNEESFFSLWFDLE